MGILRNGDERKSIQKMVAAIAITANKILRSQGVNVAYRGMELLSTALKKKFKFEFLLKSSKEEFRSHIRKIIHYNRG